MRKTVLRSLIVVAGFTVFLVVPACGGGSPTSPGSGSGSTGGTTLANGSMSARIDGSVWNASAAIVANTFAGPPTIIAIGGTDSSARNITFAVPSTGPGTYTTAANIGTNFNLLQNNQIWLAAAFQGTGTVTFTTLTSTRATGTFSFTGIASPATGATGTKSVTEGVFNVTF